MTIDFFSKFFSSFCSLLVDFNDEIIYLQIYKILINYKNRIELIKFDTVYNKNINLPNTIVTLKDLDTIIEEKYA